MEKTEKIKQGKRNRRSGRDFELKVRKDMESKGWTVCKWSNNIENGKIIPAKHKFNPFMKTLSMGTGFPDFIAFRLLDEEENFMNTGAIPRKPVIAYEVIGLEVKSSKYLDKTEKEKCAVYLTNKTFSKIVIASKCAEGIKYEDFV